MSSKYGVATMAAVSGEAAAPFLLSPANGGGGTASTSVEKNQAAGEARP